MNELTSQDGFAPDELSRHRCRHREPTAPTPRRFWGPRFLIVSLVMLQACSLRPTISRHVTVIEGESEAIDAQQRAAADARRRAPEEFEQHTFPLDAQQAVVGTLLSMRIGPDETLSDVARHFGLGYEEIALANPDIDPWVPKAGSEVLIPQLFVLPRAERRGIVINLAAMRLFRFNKGESGTQVTTYPVGIGREGKSTPTGAMAIARKTKHPAWYPTKNILADHAKRGDPLPSMVPAGPDNPLGDYAMYLTRPSYLIHGTNKPFSVGIRASNGCIRMYPENIEPLFGAATLREPVQIVNQPYLFGWRGDVVYLQAYPPHEEVNAGAARAAVQADLKALQDNKNHPLDWDRVASILNEARGIPLPISQAAPATDAFLASAVPVRHPGVLFGKPTLPADDPAGAWHVFATDTASEITARRVTAVLTHQGPPIPAKAVEVGERYQVIAGPFPDAKTAKVAAHRIRADLELEPRVLAPDEQVAGTPLSPASSGAGSAAAASSGWREETRRPAETAAPAATAADAALESPRPAEPPVYREADGALPENPAEPGQTIAAPPANEPVWTEVSPSTPTVFEAADPPPEPAAESAPPAENNAPASTPDPYDAAAWPDPAPAPESSADSNEESSPTAESETETDKRLDLRVLEYPPQVYTPSYGGDPIRFIEPGNP